MIKVFPILLSSVMIFLVSCGSPKKPAFGPENEIYVIADSTEFEELRLALEESFQQVIYTPQPEFIFDIRRIDLSSLNKYKNRKNIIIIAPLNSNSSVSEYINSIIDSTVKEKINNLEEFVINRYDVWARDQLVMVLTGPSIQHLQSNLIRESDNLIYYFRKISDQRLFQSLYNPKYERKDIEAKLLDNYGWIIYVQADFTLAKESPEDNFVWLRRSPHGEMERWVFVHWIENASPELLDVDSIRMIRNQMTKQFYRTSDDKSYIVIADDYFTSGEVNFNGRYAILTQGLWELNIKGMGGPFVNYTFYDENTSRIYMLDGSIYAPKYYKRNLIHQVDVTLQSFMTKDEISESKINELMKLVKK